MNSIWGMYNKYSVHNFKSKQCEDTSEHFTEGLVLLFKITVDINSFDFIGIRLICQQIYGFSDQYWIRSFLLNYAQWSKFCCSRKNMRTSVDMLCDEIYNSKQFRCGKTMVVSKYQYTKITFILACNCSPSHHRVDSVIESSLRSKIMHCIIWAETFARWRWMITNQFLKIWLLSFNIINFKEILIYLILRPSRINEVRLHNLYLALCKHRL